MAINKVVFGNNTLIDLTSDTIEANKLLKGFTAHDASGASIVGTYEGGGEGYTINLTASSSELYGQDIVVSYEGQRITTIQFSNAGTASIVVQEEGAYNFAVSYGGLTYYCDVNVVSAIVTYNETIYYYPNGSTVTPVNDVQIWISCADVRDKNYITLAEVLADVQLLATLMSSENAVNYLVRSKSFIGNEALIPVMTSNTTPSGVCSANSAYGTSGYEPFRAFNNNSSDWYHSSINPTLPVNLMYEFPTPVVVSKFRLVPQYYSSKSYVKAYKIQASNDNSIWEDLYTDELLNEPTDKTASFSNTTAYKYYRISVSSSYVTGGAVAIVVLQFYSPSVIDNSIAMSYIGANDYCTNTLLADSDWCEAICNSTYFESVLNVKVPKMTSNTTPSGVCSGSSKYTGRDYYQAFDGSNSTYWYATDSDIPAYIQYQFTSAVKVKYVVFNVSGGTDPSQVRVKDYDIKADDVVVYSGTHQTTSETEKAYLYNNETSATTWQVYVKNMWGGARIGLNALQFYGRENGGVQTWLHLAGITDKTYTTLSEVFADSATLSALMANHDAVDYLVTCKGWTTEVCSNQSAMSYIGLNNYAANTLLADSDWLNAIWSSSYRESVLNVKVPVMTSNTTPSGICSGSSTHTGDYYIPFRNTIDKNYWYGRPTSNSYIQYDFGKSVRLYKAYIYLQGNSSVANTWNLYYQGSVDGNTFETISEPFSTGSIKVGQYFENNTLLNTNSNIRVCRLATPSDVYTPEIHKIQFYGREDV